MKDVYLNAAGSFLPGEPVSNDRMIDFIGDVDQQSARLGKLVLRQNGIETRHYAIAPDGAVNQTNAGMAAGAVHDLIGKSEIDLADIGYLATATTQGDLLVPGHASMVHGELGAPPLEIASFQSVCASAMMAAKSACLNVKAGEHDTAVVTGSEFSSRWFRPGFYQHADTYLADDDGRLNAEFLRWTLSDGAGALLFEDRSNDHGPSFKVEWIDLISLADRFDPCMFAGTNMANRASLKKAWAHYGNPVEATRDGAVMLLQDFVLLKRIIRAWVGRYLELVEDGRIVPDEIDWLLCHYSARSLREEIVEILETTGGMIPEDRWFTNLPTKGNTGSASLFIMLDEFIATGKAKPGDRILCIVPESGRAIVSFMMLTAL